MILDRKEFIKAALVMAGAGLGLTRLAGCTGNNPSPGPPDAANSNDTNGTGGNACDVNDPMETIANNHGHVLVVSREDVALGTLRMYSIRGTAAHDHTVTLSVGNFSTLKSGQTLRLTSSMGGGHDHAITVVCA
jgi:hypothetical protein